MEACVPAVGGFSLDKRAEVPERAKASVLSRPRTPTVAEFISSDLMLSVLLIAERSGASKGVTERSDGTSVGIVERGGRLVLPLTERSVSGAFGQKCPTVKGRPPSAKCYDLL
jgi:hypothetical protein